MGLSLRVAHPLQEVQEVLVALRLPVRDVSVVCKTITLSNIGFLIFYTGDSLVVQLLL